MGIAVARAPHGGGAAAGGIVYPVLAERDGGGFHVVSSGVPPPPLSAKSLESLSWRKIPGKILMPNNLGTKLLKMNNLERVNRALRGNRGLEYHRAGERLRARSDVTLWVWKTLFFLDAIVSPGRVEGSHRRRFLSPLRGWFFLQPLAHGLRRGLYSAAASRLARARHLSCCGIEPIIIVTLETCRNRS